MNEGFIDVVYTNAYFDFDDYDQPIKTYLSSSDNLYFVSNYVSWMQFLVQTNKAETSDNRFVSDASESTSFYAVKDKVQRIANVDGFLSDPVAILTFFIDQESEIYERRVFKFLDILSYIYGLYGIIFGFGGILVNSFKRNLLERSMMKRLYQIDVRKDAQRHDLGKEMIHNDPNIDNSEGKYAFEDCDHIPRTEARLQINELIEEEKFK